MGLRDSGGLTAGCAASNVCVTSSPRRLLLLLVMVVAMVGVVVVPGAEGTRPGGHQILRGRCYSHCILRHLLQTTPEESLTETEADLLPRNPIRACQQHEDCKWCLYVCERPEDHYTNSTGCLRDCRYTRTRPRSSGRQACTEACGFVGRAAGARGGSCPVPESLTGFQSACVTSCRRDHDCSRAEEKCCSNYCGTICTQPYDLHILPPVPTHVNFKMLKSGGVLIKWRLWEDSLTTDSTEDSGGLSSRRRTDQERSAAMWSGSPVVFILRWWCPYTTGAVTSVTDRARTTLNGYPTGIYPGSKCHFMVAAVTVHGSRGFSQVSPYVKQFLTPSPPLHLEQVKTRLHSDGLADVTIQWQPPVYTDGLSIFKYQVFWSDHLPQASASLMRLHMYRRLIDGDKTTFVLQSLRPGTLYFVQVRAVVRWKGQQKRGELASAYIETYSPLPLPGEEERARGGGRREDGEDSESGMIQSVHVNQTFYHDTILKANVTWTLKPDRSARKYLIYWRAETCARSDHRKLHRRLETSATSHERRFVLYNLQPQCQYAVRVHPVTKRGTTGAATVTNFLTPPCHLVTVHKGESPTCDSAEPPGEVHGFHSETSRCVTVLRWEPPSSTGDDAVEGYDVMWGQTEAGAFSTSTIIYTSPPLELSVPGNVTQVTLGRLTAGRHYSMQVRARSAGGSGPPVILHLTAPFPDMPCTPPLDSSAVSQGPANVTSPSFNHIMALSEGNDVSGGESRSPSVQANKTVSGDWDSDVSTKLDVTGRGGHGEDGGVEGGHSFNVTGVGWGQSTSPAPSESAKDLSGPAPAGGVGEGGRDSQYQDPDEPSRRQTTTDTFNTQHIMQSATAQSTFHPANSSAARLPGDKRLWSSIITSSISPTKTETGMGVSLRASSRTWLAGLLLLMLCVRVQARMLCWC